MLTHSLDEFCSITPLNLFSDRDGACSADGHTGSYFVQVDVQRNSDPLMSDGAAEFPSDFFVGPTQHNGACRSPEEVGGGGHPGRH